VDRSRPSPIPWTAAQSQIVDVHCYKSSHLGKNLLGIKVKLTVRHGDQGHSAVAGTPVGSL